MAKAGEHHLGGEAGCAGSWFQWQNKSGEDMDKVE